MPKITVVTAVYNQVDYIEHTIQSVLNQQYKNLEYIVVDGVSNDGTSDIIDKYKDDLSLIIREPDNGLYDALNKGFSKSTGEVMCYLNGDDIFYCGTLDTVAEIFKLGVEWITGIPSSIDQKGRTVGVGIRERWSKYRFYSGNYKWIQQESTFWSRNLWNLSGGKIDSSYRLAGDFDLWSRFFQHADLYSVNTILGGFRWRSSNQLSLEGISEYELEAKKILKQRIDSLNDRDKDWLQTIAKKRQKKSIIPGVNRLNFKSDAEWFKYPPLILFDRNNQSYYIKK